MGRDINPISNENPRPRKKFGQKNRSTKGSPKTPNSVIIHAYADEENETGPIFFIITKSRTCCRLVVDTGGNTKTQNTWCCFILNGLPKKRN